MSSHTKPLSPNPLSPEERSRILYIVREHAPKDAKLSVSRPARRTITPTTYRGTGNLHGLIRNTFPYLSPAIWRAITQQVTQYAEQENSGRTPDVWTIKMLWRDMMTPLYFPLPRPEPTDAEMENIMNRLYALYFPANDSPSMAPVRESTSTQAAYGIMRPVNA